MMDVPLIERLGTVALLASFVALAGCGGGAGGVPATPPPPPPSGHTLTIQSTGAGSVQSQPAGLACSSSPCSATFPDQTPVTLTAQAGSHYTLEGWSGACTSEGTSCALTLSQDTTITAKFAPVVPVAGAPFIDYLDTTSAPTTGGEDGKGGYLSIFGTGFGAASGLGSTTKVYIGGVEVANYRYVGPSKVAPKLGIQQIAVQVGSLGGAAAGKALPVQVVVDGKASNIDQAFTPTTGHVLFVSLSGDDATAARDDIGHPWRYLQNQQNLNHRTGAYYAMGAGDQVVIRGGSYSDTFGVDHTWMRFDMNGNARNGRPDACIHITAYPGAVNGHGVEDVHYTTPPGTPGGIEGPWSDIAGTSGEFIAVSNLHFDVQAGASQDAAPINFQYTAGHWRVVNNEIGPWPAGNSPILNAAGISGFGDTMLVLGNLIHDIEGTADLQNHGIYADTTAQNWEVAYNWIHDIPGGSLVQFNDSLGGAGSFKLPHDGGIWPGFVNIDIHNNWLENAAKYGVNFNDQGSTKVGKYSGMVWNNVIIGTQLPPLRINATQPVQQLWFAFNTLYDDMITNSYTGNGYVRAEGWSGMPGVQNVFYDNIFALGPHTTHGTLWFADAGAKRASTSNYDFKRNLYSAAGAKGQAPAKLGDTLALVGDPLFTDAANEVLSTRAGSPASKAATQALPSGFDVVDDVTGSVWRPPGASDLGAYNSP
jgi:hypothetical protein